MKVCFIGFSPYFYDLFWVALSFIFMSGYLRMCHGNQGSRKPSIAVHDSYFPGCKGLHKG